MATIVRYGRQFGRLDESDPLNRMTIGVLYGGPSAERDVSIQSGEAVAKTLAAAGRTVHRVILDETFDVQMAQSLGIDIAFLALHGTFGEDGRVQHILERAGIPYTGSGPDASSTAFDKVLAKRVLEKNGLRTPAWMSFERDEIESMGALDALDLTPPLVVKPASCGSSLGVTVVRSACEIEGAFARALDFGDTVLAERFIAGRELSVPVLGDEPLPVIELRVRNGFYDYNAKYVSEETGIVCPAELPAELTARAQATALATHLAFGCSDVSRTDLILDANGFPWVLEINTLPGMTSHSLLPKAADAVGTDFLALCEFLILRAASRGAGRARAA